MPADLVLTEHHDGVLIITINRPAQKNAVNHEVAVQLAAAVDRLDSDPQLVQGLNDTDALARQDPIVAGLIASDDAHEGARAFADKRAPVWRGR